MSEELGVELEDTRFQVGKIAGQLAAMEGRMNRFEALVDTRLSSVDAKLDTITAAILRQEGARKGQASLGHWFLGALAGCSWLLSWALVHFLGSSPSGH